MSKVIDLDKELGFDDQDEPQVTKQVTMFKQEWTMVCDLNHWNVVAIGEDPAALSRLILSCVILEQQAAFSEALSRVKNLDEDKLRRIINVIVEAVSERPTTAPSPSTRGAQKSTSPRKSAASSSRRGAAPKR